jgi:hypothetical protein
VRVHHVGKPLGVNRILIDGINVGNQATQHGAHHVGR